MRWIFNADDFGASSAVNAAVVQAHRAGLLTSASLMVGGAAFEEAVTLARGLPRLAVGLHLVLVDGAAVLHGHQHIADQSGRFRTSPFRAGVAYACSSAARHELSAEIAAQFSRFAATGLPLSHVDGHCHMHLHPAMFSTTLRLARRYGAGGIRLPHDDLRLALRLDARHLVDKLTWTLIFGLLTRWAKARIRKVQREDPTGPRLIWPERTYGFMQTGQLNERYLRRLIDSGAAATAEVYCHPTTGQRLAELGPNRAELEALLSPAVQAAVARRGIVPVNYADLRSREPALQISAAKARAAAAVGGPA